eukprot:TRINITY_DN99_c2_g5_i1.p1 TRINITY_DN99_c2_g5~~TRINITY_DN99_c2_g5_i1.p1  ORF type:complete len:1185 (-),score=353.67 TRINITY_DN99_c2_g5_i1:433-3936(-)
MAKRLLKIIIIEAKLGVKDKEKKTPRKVKTYHVSVDVVDFQGNPIGGDFTYKTKEVLDQSANRTPSWNQTCVFSIPSSGVGFSHTGIDIKVMSGAKVHGSCTTIPIADLSDSMESKWYPLESKFQGASVHAKLGWYGAKDEKSTQNFRQSLPPRFVTSGASNELSQQALDKAMAQELKKKNDEIMKLAAQIESLKTDVTNQSQRCTSLESVLKKYRDIDDDARKLVGAGIDWKEIRVQARQLQQKRRRETVRKSVRVNLFDDDSPRAYAEFILGNTDLHHVSTIKKKLATSDAKWLKQFLVADGLFNIYNLLKIVEQKNTLDLQISMKEAALASCVKTLMNNQAICEYIIRQSQDLLKDLILIVLQSKNNLMRVQMCNLFSALCIYGSAGHRVVYDATKLVGLNTKPFNFILNILKEETDREIMTATMCLINGIISGEKELSARMKLRALFTDSDLLSTINELKQQLPDEKEELRMQIRVFENMSVKDDEELRDLRYIGNMDLFNHRSLFNQVLEQAEAVGANELFLHHLQHLLTIPNFSSNPMTAWRVVERASRRVTTSSESASLSEITPSEINKLVYQMVKLEEAKAKREGKPGYGVWQKAVRTLASSNNPNAKPGSSDQPTEEKKLSDSNPGVKATSPAPPPPPPTSSDPKPVLAASVIKKPAGPQGTQPPSRRPRVTRTKPPPPPPTIPGGAPLPPMAPISENQATETKETDDTVPEPQVKMRPFFWDPVSPDQLLSESPNGGEVGQYWNNLIPEMETIDTMFQDLQTIFFAPKAKNTKKKKISFLPLRLANNISILRSQFKISDEEILKQLFDIDSGSETLQTHHFEAILGCIPDDLEQVSSLIEYNGPLDDLDKPDRFLLTLLSVRNVKDKIKCLILWDEFSLRVTTVTQALETMTKACAEILNSPKLKNILGIILSVGNFLNAGTARGRQRGIQATSLKKLNEVRSPLDNKYTLLNYLVGFIETNFSELTTFQKELSHLEEAVRFQPDIIQEEVAALERGVSHVQNQISTADDSEMNDDTFLLFYDSLNKFVLFARIELDRIEEKFVAFQEQSSMVLKTFGHSSDHPIQDVWGSFYLFAKQFNTTLQENKQKQEEEKRRAMMEMTFSSMNDEAESDKSFEKPKQDEEQDEEVAGMMDKLIASIRAGIYTIETGPNSNNSL